MQTKQNKLGDEPTIKVTDSQIAAFYESLSNYGYADIETAIEKFKEVKLSASDLADEVKEFADSTNSPIDKIDICYMAYDHILQIARNKLDEVLDFDICNDIEDGTEFYTSGNYMCTSYDYSQEAKDQLEKKLKDADESQIEELFDDIFVKVFLKNVGINEIQKTEELEDEE